MIAHATSNYPAQVEALAPAPSPRLTDRCGNPLKPGDRVVLTGTVAHVSGVPGKRNFYVDIDRGEGKTPERFTVTGECVELLGAPVEMPEAEEGDPAEQVVS